MRSNRSLCVYASPRFYRDDKGIFAEYVFTSGTSYIFPQEPRVPLGVLDPDSGKALKCSCWRVLLKAEDEKEVFGELEYSDFLYKVPKNKIERYDGEHICISEVSEEEIKSFSANKERLVKKANAGKNSCPHLLFCLNFIIFIWKPLFFYRLLFSEDVYANYCDGKQSHCNTNRNDPCGSLFR